MTFISKFILIFSLGLISCGHSEYKEKETKFDSRLRITITNNRDIPYTQASHPVEYTSLISGLSQKEYSKKEVRKHQLYTYPAKTMAVLGAGVGVSFFLGMFNGSVNEKAFLLAPLLLLMSSYSDYISSKKLQYAVENHNNYLDEQAKKKNIKPKPGIYLSIPIE